MNKTVSHSLTRAAAWGLAASAIAFWVNQLVVGQFPEAWAVLLVVPVVEEIAKYLGLRETGSVVIPIVFLIGESVVQASGYVSMIGDPRMIWLFYIPFALVVFKHLLFYALMYLCDFRIHGLLLAIIAHSVWNWYSVASKGQDVIPLSLITLAVIIFPVLALYKRGRGKNDRSGL